MQSSGPSKLRWVSVDCHAIRASKRKSRQPRTPVPKKKAKSGSNDDFGRQSLTEVQIERAASLSDGGATSQSSEAAPASRELTIYKSTPSPPAEINSPNIPQWLAANGDPFNTYPIRNVYSVDNAVDYWVRTYSPTHEPMIPDYWRTSLPAAQKNPFMSVVFAMAMGDAALFQGLVMLSQATSVSSERRKPSASKALLIHHNEALAKLRERMSDEQHRMDDITILAITLLAAADLNLGHVNTCVMHLNALRPVVEARGGLRALGGAGFIRKLLTYICIRARVPPPVDTTTPFTPPATPPAGSGSPVLEYSGPSVTPLSKAITSMLPPSLQVLANSGVLSTQTLHLLGRLSCYLQASDRLRIGVAEPQDWHVVRAYELLNESYRAQRLAEHLSSSLQPSLSSAKELPKAPPTEQLVLMAFYMFLWTVTFRMTLTPFDQDRLDFIAIYGTQWDILTRTEQKLLIWTTIMVADMGRECRLLQETLETLMSTILDNEEQCWEWEWLEGVCRGFFHHDKMIVGWESCWQVHVARKRRKLGLPNHVFEVYP